MERKVLLEVEGMDCANCATTITKTLNREGLKDVSVDFLTGEVCFIEPGKESVEQAVSSIQKLGYVVKNTKEIGSEKEEVHAHTSVNRTRTKFLISLIFSVPLVLHMLVPFPLLHQPFFQLALSLPVLFIGITHFGKSAFFSLRAGSPNMDVLIFTGSTAAFVYSVAGMALYYGTDEVSKYLFFETSATIITLVLLGNLIEQRSIRHTTSAIMQLGKLQPQTARKIVLEDGHETTVESNIKELKVGDKVIVNSGDRIPYDGTVSYGSATIDESMLTGESRPVFKSINESVTGGTLVEDGSLKVTVDKTGNDTVLARIIELVKAAQHSKPELQKLGDRISAVFVPIVIAISVLTFVVSAFIVHIPAQDALMSSIAVLVISCPCAMGLATPTAVMVGLGRAARNGILVKGGSTVEELSKIRNIVFDKTGTLTTGNFRIRKIECHGEDETNVKRILYALESHSSHPVAKSIQKELRQYSNENIHWKDISEDKGVGINATDNEGNLYSVGSFQMARHLITDFTHDVYLLRNNKLIATIDMEDEIKPGTKEVISDLKNQGLQVIMLSGDREKTCKAVADAVGITEVYAEKMPAEKLAILDALIKKHPTAMVGDGINDAPALTRASVGISISNATQAAIQSSQVILMDKQDLSILLRALKLGSLTYSTIKQNLFWAFFYNVLAIPVAAAGLLNPMIGALSMAFSDVIVIGNSLRLRYRKL